MSVSKDFLDYARDLFRGVGPVTFKRMFGGVGVYADGLIFALGSDETIYLKTDAETRDRFEAAGSRPFTYQKRGHEVGVTAYLSLPESALDDPDEAAEWARLAIGASVRAAARKRGRRT